MAQRPWRSKATVVNARRICQDQGSSSSRERKQRDSWREAIICLVHVHAQRWFPHCFRGGWYRELVHPAQLAETVAVGARGVVQRAIINARVRGVDPRLEQRADSIVNMLLIYAETTDHFSKVCSPILAQHYIVIAGLPQLVSPVLTLRVMWFVRSGAHFPFHRFRNTD